MVRLYLIPLVILLGLSTTSAFAQRAGAKSRADREQVRASDTVAGLQKNLKEARRLLVEIDDKRTRERLELLLSRAALQAEDLEELLGDSTDPRVKRPMSEADFARLLKGLKERSFDEDKLEFIETFVKGRPLTCKQATEVIKLVSFDEGRAKAAIALHPSIVDAEHFFEVLKVFPFDSTRKEVMEAIRKKKR